MEYRLSAVETVGFAPRGRIGALSLVLVAAACRDASSSGTTTVALAPNASGANGCSGPDLVFTPPQSPTVVALATLAIGPRSQITAARGSETLYATGVGATVVAIDVSGALPLETELVSAGTIATLIAASGVSDAPDLSAIAVLDANTLVVMEHSSNALIAVDRVLPDTVLHFAGQPNAVPGFADGLAIGPGGLARFSFTESSQICPTADVPQRVFVADSGNHALRMITTEGQPGFEVRTVSTVAGDGIPGFDDGELDGAAFDTPTGLTASCNGMLIVSERGDFGFGQRLRELAIGLADPFGGGFLGTSGTLVGNGVAATTEGDALTATVSAPMSPLATRDGDVYWVDSGSGVLRRLRTDGSVDCPLAVDCATAVSTPSFPPNHVFSLTETDGGKLFVLDATAGVFYRVTP